VKVIESDAQTSEHVEKESGREGERKRRTNRHCAAPAALVVVVCELYLLGVRSGGENTSNGM
jgi:hypothetical protein